MALSPRKMGPRTPAAERLEEVREKRGIATIQEFVERLAEDGGYEVNYSTARRYHTDREPPAHYFARVSEKFGFNLAWLITGSGAPFGIGETPASRGLPGPREGAEEGQNASEPATDISALTDGAGENLFAAVMEKIEGAQPAGGPEINNTHRLLLGWALNNTIAGVVNALNPPESSAPSIRQSATVSFLTSILIATPGPEEGRPVADVIRSLPIYSAKAVEKTRDG